MPEGSSISLRSAPACPLSNQRLRLLVLDYLLKSCAIETAEAFVRDWPDDDTCGEQSSSSDGSRNALAMDVEPREVHADTNGHGMPSTNGHATYRDADLEVGASPHLTAAIRRHTNARRDIRKNITNGRIQTAIDLCNSSFPSLLRPSTPPFSATAMRPLSTTLSPSIGGHSRSASVAKQAHVYKLGELTDPALLSLDLQIQMFIESVRNAANALATTSLTTSSGDHLTAPADDGASSQSSGSTISYSAFSSALALAQTLHAQASALPSPVHRARYLKELENVSGLIAYQNPDESPIRRFLDIERRAELANGIDKAILLLLGEEPETVLERAVRQTEAVWRQLALDRVPFPPERGKEKQHPTYISELQLNDFLNSLHAD